MSGHNIYFHGEQEKLPLNYPQYSLVSGALDYEQWNLVYDGNNFHLLWE